MVLGFSAFGLPVLGDTSSPHFLSRIYYNLRHAKSQAYFSRHTEAAGCCGLGEPLAQFRGGLSQGGGIQPGRCDGLPCYPVFPGPQLFGPLFGHAGLDGVLDGFGFGGGLFNQGLELAQLPDFAFHFVNTH